MDRVGEDEEDERIVRKTSQTAMKVSGLHQHSVRDEMVDSSFLNVVFLPQLMQKLLCRSLRDQLYA